MAIEIRELTPSDFDALLDLWPKQSADQAGPKPTVDDLWHLLQQMPNLSLVASEDAALIGAMLVGKDPHDATVYQIVLAQSDPQQQLTRKLVDKGLMKLAARRLHKCQLTRVDGEQDGCFWDLIRWHAQSDDAAGEQVASTAGPTGQEQDAPPQPIAADNAEA